MTDQPPGQDASSVAARIQASFDRQGLMRLLRASITHVEPGRVQITLPRRQPPRTCGR